MSWATSISILKRKGHSYFQTLLLLMTRMQMWWLELKQWYWVLKWKLHAELDRAGRQKEPWVPDIVESPISPRIPSSGLFLEERNKFLLCLSYYHFCGLYYYHLWVYLILIDWPISKFSFATSPGPLRMSPPYNWFSYLLPTPTKLSGFFSFL